MIVADINLVAYLLIQGDQTALAERLYTLDSAWHLPEQWRFELVNILTTYIRNKLLTLSRAVAIYRKAETLFGDATHAVSPLEALETATAFNISGYDAHYVRLAEMLDLPCVTSDRKMRRDAPARVLTLAEMIKRLS